MVAEGGPVDQVLGQHRRLVLGARDLLDHDAALAVELLGVDLRAPDEVGQQVDRLGRHLGPAGDVEGDEVVRRVRVEHRAHRLGRLVDLAVVVVLLPALEHQMLKKMGHSVLFRTLGPRPRVEGHEHRGGAGRQLHAVQRKAVRQGGGLDARHRALRLLQGNLRLQRTPPRTVDPQTYGSHRTTSASSPASRRPASPVLSAASACHRRGAVLQRRGDALQRDGRRARPRVLRHLPGRVRLPGRPLRLRQVDRDEAPDQGARAHRRRDPRRRARPAADSARPACRTTAATSA